MNAARPPSGPQALCWLAIACGIAGVAPHAHAVELVSNITEPVRGTTTIDTSLYAAQAFSTDANLYRLVSIDLLLGSMTAGSSPFAELHADAAGQPGNTLATLSLAGLGSGPQSLVNLVASAVVLLDADSAYWIVLGDTGSGSFGFSYGEGNASTGPGALGGYRYSSDAGLSWGSMGLENPYSLRVNVIAVPEPSALALLLVGLVGGGLLRCARRRVAG